MRGRLWGDVVFQGHGYHQDYYRLNSGQPYCRLVIDLKIKKLQKAFADKLKVPPP